jgi:HPt (histidine-containing phosphotransfer) domain-containing protein
MSESLIDKDVFDELVNMVGADFIGELIDTFLEESPQLISTLTESLASADTDGFRRAAHSLKSNSATFGAMKLSEIAKELELMAKNNQIDQAGSKIDQLVSQHTPVESKLREVRNEYA